MTAFFFNDPPTTEIYTLSLHDALPIWRRARDSATADVLRRRRSATHSMEYVCGGVRSEEHTSELQSRRELVCRLLLEKKKICRNNRSRPAWSVTSWP